MKRAASILALCGAACGHDMAKVTPDAAPIPDAAIDASPFHATVHGTLVGLASENGADNSPVVITSAPDPAVTHLSVVRADGSTDPVLLASDGTFEFGVVSAGQAYRLTLAIDGQVPKDFQSAASTLAIGLVGAGRNPRAALAPGSDIVIKAVFGNWVDGDTAVLETTGLWTETEAQFVTSPGTNETEPWAFQWQWSTVTSLSGDVGLLDASQHDALQITAWRPNAGSGYTAMVGALVHSDVTMTSGTNIELGADDAPISIPPLAQRCLHVTAPRAAELARIATAVPDTYFQARDEWDLFAPAGAGLGPTGAQLIATGGEVGSATDADLTASFGNPFGGDTLLVSTSAHQVREIHAVAGDDGVFLQAGTQTWAEVAMPASCAATPATVTATPAVAIPSVPSLAGVALDHDGAIVPIAATDIAVTWTDAAAGVADEYVTNLVELTEVSQQTTLATVRGVFGTTPAAAFDASELVPGHTYMIEVFARQGFPGAGSGDFATITLPFANAVTLSHTFTVTR